jgi:hypothetical protein
MLLPLQCKFILKIYTMKHVMQGVKTAQFFSITSPCLKIKTARYGNQNYFSRLIFKDREIIINLNFY